MKNFFRKVSALFLSTPIPPVAAPIGAFRSVLATRGERLGGSVVETLVARAEIAAIGAAFDRFLGEARGTLALKKALHLTVEECMRALSLVADPPETYGFGPVPRPPMPHPLDTIAAAELGVATLARPTWRASFALALSAIVQGVTLLVRAVWLGTVTTHVRGSKRHFRVGAPAFARATDWAPVRRAIADARPAMPDDLAVVIEDGYAVDPGAEVPVIRPADCAIDRRRWWREVVRPAFRLTATVLASVLRQPLDPVCTTAAWFVCHLARTTLDFRRVLHSVTFDNYLDIIEYSPTHIVKAALIGRAGGKLVRWPHCYLDNPGATVSHLGYHLFLGTGPYEAETYGKTWAPDCARKTVGFFKNDRRWFTSETQLSPEIAQLVESQRAAGRRLFVYFGPSAIPDMVPVVLSTLAAVAAAIADAPDWVLVVKAKNYGAFQMMKDAVSKSDAAKGLETEGRLVVVPYSTRGAEPCSAGWLIRQMAVGVGLGSVQLEALTQGKPCFSYLPVTQATPYQQRLAACGLGHNDAARFEAAIARWRDDPDALDIPFDWFRDAFDPFADDHALDRIVEEIWAQPPIRKSGTAPGGACRDRGGGDVGARGDAPRTM